LTVHDRVASIPFDQEKLFIWLKEYIDYSRSDFLKMDVIRFYALVRVAEKKQIAKKNSRSRK